MDFFNSLLAKPACRRRPSPRGWPRRLVLTSASPGCCGPRARRLQPTLTGLGERSHLLHPGIDLDHHIRESLRCSNTTRDVILVGHSYGGMVITGVADRALSASDSSSISTPRTRETVESLVDSRTHHEAVARLPVDRRRRRARALPSPERACQSLRSHQPRRFRMDGATS